MTVDFTPYSIDCYTTCHHVLLLKKQQTESPFLIQNISFSSVNNGLSFSFFQVSLLKVLVRSAGSIGAMMPPLSLQKPSPSLEGNKRWFILEPDVSDQSPGTQAQFTLNSMFKVVPVSVMVL